MILDSGWRGRRVLSPDAADPLYTIVEGYDNVIILAAHEQGSAALTCGRQWRDRTRYPIAEEGGFHTQSIEIDARKQVGKLVFGGALVGGDEGSFIRLKPGLVKSLLGDHT